MIKINIESPMILNSKLVKSSNFEKNAKVLQFLFPITENIKTIPQFNSYKMISDSFKHMILCLSEDLAINPVFFALSKIRFLEQNYINILKDKNLLNQELMNTLYNCDSVINYIEFLLSEKVDPYKFGANIWDIEDQTNQSYWVKEKNKL